MGSVSTFKVQGPSPTCHSSLFASFSFDLSHLFVHQHQTNRTILACFEHFRNSLHWLMKVNNFVLNCKSDTCSGVKHERALSSVIILLLALRYKTCFARQFACAIDKSTFDFCCLMPIDCEKGVYTANFELSSKPQTSKRSP
jgi:hypothetical protein